MKYKVGNKVRVRADLIQGRTYRGITLYSGDMSLCKGKEYLIRIADENDRTYKLVNNDYWWTEEMLEPVSEVTQ